MGGFAAGAGFAPAPVLTEWISLTSVERGQESRTPFLEMFSLKTATKALARVADVTRTDKTKREELKEKDRIQALPDGELIEVSVLLEQPQAEVRSGRVGYPVPGVDAPVRLSEDALQGA